MSFCVMTAYAKIDAYFTVLFKSCGFKGFFLAYSCAVEKLSLIFIRLIYRGGKLRQNAASYKKEAIKVTISADHRAPQGQ